ncbi:hypothetical protein KFK09_005310 [Dendrobium nobile]|uniref:Uncharacterized protein n=1 Tax=Dendrobium nobile TaxID=94219 RepID=A0A8T3BY31_DENNO|nr:hypothetical protein KFK09_005310 [Dendrobium nobile]
MWIVSGSDSILPVAVVPAEIEKGREEVNLITNSLVVVPVSVVDFQVMANCVGNSSGLDSRNQNNCLVDSSDVESDSQSVESDNDVTLVRNSKLLFVLLLREALGYDVLGVQVMVLLCWWYLLSGGSVRVSLDADSFVFGREYQLNYCRFGSSLVSFVSVVRAVSSSLIAFNVSKIYCFPLAKISMGLTIRTQQDIEDTSPHYVYIPIADVYLPACSL